MIVEQKDGDGIRVTSHVIAYRIVADDQAIYRGFVTVYINTIVVVGANGIGIYDAAQLGTG